MRQLRKARRPACGCGSMVGSIVTGSSMSSLHGFDRACPTFLQRAPSGVLTARSLAAYAGISGAVLDGRTYLPLNVDFPLERLAKIADSADASAIVLGSNELDLGLALQASLNVPPTLVVLDEDDLSIDVRSPVESACVHRRPANTAAGSEQPAYIMFTSGTTGEPKGIAIEQTNLAAYLDGIDRLFDFRPR